MHLEQSKLHVLCVFWVISAMNYPSVRSSEQGLLLVPFTRRPSGVNLV